VSAALPVENLFDRLVLDVELESAWGRSSRPFGVVKASTEHFLYGLHYELPPRKFVTHMKTKNVRIQGIGHRLRSAENPAARVELLQNHA